MQHSTIRGMGLVVSTLAGLVCVGYAAEIRCSSELRYPKSYNASVQSFGTLQGGGSMTHVVVTPADFGARNVGMSLEATAIAYPQMNGGAALMAMQESRRMDGTTDLMLAATAGDAARVRQWIMAGAKVNATNRYGSTALMGAAAGGFDEVVKVLLTHWAEVNARSKTGLTPLLAAVKNSHASTARMLLDDGATVDATDGEGKTALIHAVKTKNTDLVKILIEHGADVNRKDNFGQTAVQMATYLNNQELVILMTSPAKSSGVQR